MSKIKVGEIELEFEHTAANKDIHMLIDGAHNPKLCPECIERGSLTSPTPTPDTTQGFHKDKWVKEKPPVTTIENLVIADKQDDKKHKLIYAEFPPLGTVSTAIFTSQQSNSVEEIVKDLVVDIFDLVGDEFAPKQENGSPERKRLLGLLAHTTPLQIEATHQLNLLLLEIIGEDEPEYKKHYGGLRANYLYARKRNQLRAELRAKLTKGIEPNE